MPSQICIGCRVSGAVGPYLPICPERQREGGRQRRSRSRYHGGVVRSFAEKKWTVYWEEVEKATDHSSQALKFEKKAPTEGLAGLDLESILNENYVQDLKGLDKAWAAMGHQSRQQAQCRPPAVTGGATVENIGHPVATVPTTIPVIVPPPL
jgi:hypothetical protein